jgi:hypothetical protein
LASSLDAHLLGIQIDIHATFHPFNLQMSDGLVRFSCPVVIQVIGNSSVVRRVFGGQRKLLPGRRNGLYRCGIITNRWSKGRAELCGRRAKATRWGEDPRS